MNKKLNLTVLTKREQKKVKAGVDPCLCGCLWDPDPSVKTDALKNLNYSINN